jgi:hypothetical protein
MFLIIRIYYPTLLYYYSLIFLKLLCQKQKSRKTVFRLINNKIMTFLASNVGSTNALLPTLDMPVERSEVPQFIFGLSEGRPQVRPLPLEQVNFLFLQLCHLPPMINLLFGVNVGNLFSNQRLQAIYIRFAHHGTWPIAFAVTPRISVWSCSIVIVALLSVETCPSCVDKNTLPSSSSLTWTLISLCQTSHPFHAQKRL